MINHSDVIIIVILFIQQTKNIQFKIASKAKEMREKGIKAMDSLNREQAKYYLQRMREVQQLIMNPTAIKVWAELQMDAYKKGKILNVFKVKPIDYQNIHAAQIEHIRWTKNEKFVALMSKDFMVSFWEVGSWTMKDKFRAYHNSNAKFYGKKFNMDEV